MKEEPQCFLDLELMCTAETQPMKDPFSEPADFEWLVATKGWDAVVACDGHKQQLFAPSRPLIPHLPSSQDSCFANLAAPLLPFGV